MARTMSPERQREYDELLAYVSFFATHVMRVAPENPIHPANVAVEVVQRFGKSKALEGVRQAANDTVEQMQDWPVIAISVLDGALLANNVVTASEVRRRFSSSYRRVLKRGKIETETEYHLVNSIVVAQGAQTGEAERMMLQGLVSVYEERT